MYENENNAKPQNYDEEYKQKKISKQIENHDKIPQNHTKINKSKIRDFQSTSTIKTHILNIKQPHIV